MALPNSHCSGLYSWLIFCGMLNATPLRVLLAATGSPQRPKGSSITMMLHNIPQIGRFSAQT